MQRKVCAVFVCLLFVAIATTSSAEVLCARKSGAVKVHTVCKSSERQLDPVALGLQGPAGPQGETGPAGSQGDVGEQGPQGNTGPAGTIPCATVSGTDVFFSGCNVHIVNGEGSTATTNGLGNLIVGYNESVDNEDLYRSGSHNVVIGRRHIYTSFGGFVAGHQNTITGESASVSGGHASWARGKYSSVSGGYNNAADGELSSVSGGRVRTASDQTSWAAGSLYEPN